MQQKVLLNTGNTISLNNSVTRGKLLLSLSYKYVILAHGLATIHEKSTFFNGHKLTFTR